MSGYGMGDRDGVDLEERPETASANEMRRFVFALCRIEVFGNVFWDEAWVSSWAGGGEGVVLGLCGLSGSSLSWRVGC